MRIVNGKRVEVLTGLQTFSKGLLTYADAMACAAWDAANLKKGSVRKIVYVNGVYTGVMDVKEKFADMCHRLKIVS